MAPLEIGSLEQNHARARKSVQATGQPATLVIQYEDAGVQIAQRVVSWLVQRP